MDNVNTIDWKTDLKKEVFFKVKSFSQHHVDYPIKRNLVLEKT